MSVASRPPAPAPPLSPPAAAPGRSPWPWRLLVLAVVGGALGLRLWGIAHGLPYAYNADENAHFVPGAIGLFGHGWNPHYFVNPPAYTYGLHLVFAVWFGGREGVSEAYATHPTEVFVVARATAAVVGTLAVWLLYLAGARLFDRRVGLLAAALLGVSFLAVFYAHLGLNDVPTLAPIALSLYGTAGVLRRGRPLDYAVAGAGLGLACATKYTGGIVLLPLLTAALLQLQGSARGAEAARGIVIAGLVAVACFLLANPYAVLDVRAFRDGLAHQASASDDVAGKLGLTQESGHLYYLWTITWGLGWAPLVAVGAGVVLLARYQPRALVVLAPAPLLFLLFMGTQQRFFGRWLLPIFPILCLIAAYAVVRLVDLGASRWRARGVRSVLVAVGVVALLGQGALASVHLGRVLSRDDTRNLTRAWLAEHVPVNTKIVVEPVVPDAWASDIGRVNPDISNGARWSKFPTSRSKVGEDGKLRPGRPSRVINIEDYERTLYPGLIDTYVDRGYCWLVSGSTQRGRAEVEPEQVPNAIRYYRALERRGRLVYEASPFHADATPVPFNFDWSFDFYPRAYERPGAVMRVYQLRGGRCGD